MSEKIIYCQKWEESERDWGVRPDGYSVHLTIDDRNKYIKEHWDQEPKNSPPDEYSRPSGDCYKVFDSELYETLKNEKEKHGLCYIRFYNNNFPKGM